MILVILITTVICWIIYHNLFVYLFDKSLPPGPWGYPIIGFLLDPLKAHSQLSEMAKKYGSIFTYNSFGTTVYVINGKKALKAAFSKNGDQFIDRFSGRNDLFMRERGGNYGVLASHGELWKAQRRFSLRALRNLGLGRRGLEESILDESDYLQIELLKMEGIAQNTHNPMSKAVANVISRLVFGNRFEYDDEQFFGLIEKMNEQTAQVQLVRMVGVMRYNKLLLLSAWYKVHLKLTTFIQSNIKKLIKSKQLLFNMQSEPNSYIEEYLLEKKSTTLEFEDQQQLLIATLDLFQAGSETTAITIRWALLFASFYPEHQRRIYQEIKENVGLNQRIYYGDRSRFVFTEAFLLEVQRYACLIPLPIRTGVEDVMINDYRIPAHAPVIMNIWSCMYDEQEYPDPYTFKPERFLDGDCLKRISETFLPFGLGKRVCIGESLARMELNVFFYNLIQKLEFRLDPSAPKPILQHQPGLTTLSPPNHNLVVNRRVVDL